MTRAAAASLGQTKDENLLEEHNLATNDSNQRSVVGAGHNNRLPGAKGIKNRSKNSTNDYLISCVEKMSGNISAMSSALFNKKFQYAESLQEKYSRCGGSNERIERIGN